MPMSSMPPSPPKAMTFTSSLPCMSRASLMPDATDAAFSKRTCIQGIFHEVVGYWLVVTSMQPVALQMTVFLPAALKSRRIAIAGPHPAQVRCPGASNSSFFMSIHTFSGLFFHEPFYVAVFFVNRFVDYGFYVVCSAVHAADADYVVQYFGGVFHVTVDASDFIEQGAA